MTSSVRGAGLPGVCPRHELSDVLVEMAVGQPGEQILEVGIGFDAVHLGCADQGGEAGPVSAALVMASKKRVAAVHGRAADGVLDQIGVDVDVAIAKDGRGPWRQWRRVSP